MGGGASDGVVTPGLSAQACPIGTASHRGGSCLLPACLYVQVYSEVYRVLKPGAIFMTYEWVTTPLYDPTNKQHVACVDEIIIGNGLPVRPGCSWRKGSGGWSSAEKESLLFVLHVRAVAWHDLTACCLLLTQCLQDMRTWKQAEQAGTAVGFKLLDSRDVAQASKTAVQPW